MRLSILAAAILLAGCATPPTGDDAPDDGAANASAPTTPTGELAAPTAPIGERMPATMERFVMQANQTLGVLRADDPEMPIATVPQTLSATSFWESFVKPLDLSMWPSFPLRSAFETTAPVEITLSFSASAPAVAANPRAAGFPPVGLWLGTSERIEYFLLANDAPDTLEAGKVYSVKVTATPPKGGWFVREGEMVAIYPFLGYQTADASPLSFVVGGPQPAGFVLPHEHFNLSAPTATVIVDETGEIGPNPAPTGDMHPSPIDVSFTVPADALYVVLEVTGIAKAGDRIDLDVSARSASGEHILGGTSPGATEKTALGPGNLKAYGRDLVAHVTASATPSGGTYTLKVTAYGP